VKANYESVYGQISSSWKREGENLTLNITVPPNTTALVYVPADKVEKITESAKPVIRAEGVRFIRKEDGTAVFELKSGIYSFYSTLPGKQKN
jgi:alpha-L-rhamnosidase